MHDPRAHSTHRGSRPRLDIRAPIRTGIIILAAFVVSAGSIAAVAPSAPAIAIAAVVLPPVGPVTVRYSRSGIVNQIHTTAGAKVKAGDRLVSFDTRQLDEQIAAMKMQADAARLKLAGIKQEVQVLSPSEERSDNLRRRLQTLERQLAEVEKESIGLEVQIAVAEQEVVRAEVRAPTDGVVKALHVMKAGSTVAANGPLVELQPEIDKVELDAVVPPHLVANLAPGTSIKASIVVPSSGRAETFDAVVVPASDASRLADANAVRVALIEPRSAVVRRVRLDTQLQASLRLPSPSRVRNFGTAFGRLVATPTRSAPL